MSIYKKLVLLLIYLHCLTAFFKKYIAIRLFSLSLIKLNQTVQTNRLCVNLPQPVFLTVYVHAQIQAANHVVYLDE